MRLPLWTTAWAFSILLTGCFLGEDRLSGKPCASDRDCPETFYACVVTRVDGNKSCELIFPPKAIESTQPGTPTTQWTYCKDIKPILDRTCVSSCHGATTTGSGISSFRLDLFVDSSGALSGVKAMAARIKARTTETRDMPPNAAEGPSDEERKMVGEWVDNGAPEGDPNADACAN